MLISAGALVDVKDIDKETALNYTVNNERTDCADLLLNAGAKIRNLKEDLKHPEWFVAMLKKRSSCKSGALALFGLLRKRWRVRTEKVPLDMIKMLTRMVWDTRHDERWAEVVVEESKKNIEEGRSCTMQ